MATAHLIVGLQFGDEGKGLVSAYLTQKHHSRWNVRHKGGAQAAHHVVRPNGKVHCFQQFGSGSFDYASTFLGPDVIVEPFRLLDEASELLHTHHVANPLRQHFIDGRALIITPYHIALNQLKERMRGSVRHGSTGLGIGETRSFSIRHPSLALRAEDLGKSHMPSILRDIAEIMLDEARGYDSTAKIDEVLFKQHCQSYRNAAKLIHVVPDDFFGAVVLQQDDNPVFEGAQGILLDELYGFHPHNTWT